MSATPPTVKQDLIMRPKDEPVLNKIMENIEKKAAAIPDRPTAPLINQVVLAGGLMPDNPKNAITPNQNDVNDLVNMMTKGDTALVGECTLVIKAGPGPSRELEENRKN